MLISNEDPPVKMYQSLFVAFLVLFLVSVIGLCIICYMYAAAKASANPSTVQQDAPSQKLEGGESSQKMNNSIELKNGN